MKTKHLLAMFLTVALSMGLTSCLNIEIPKTDSGNMGSIKWVYDFEAKTLTFSGSGVITREGDESYDRYSDQIKTVIINDGITVIGDEAFSNFSCNSVSMPNSVTSIGSSAFEWCYTLTSVTIPNSVTSIGLYAFKNCRSLTSVTCRAITPPTLYENAFYERYPGQIDLYVPKESISAYKEAEIWKRFRSISAIK